MATGIFNTGTFATDIVKKSFAGMITRLMPNGAAPLFGMTSMLKSETALQVEHGYYTKSMLFPEMQLDGAIGSATTTTFTVDSTANVLPGMIFRVVNSNGFENVLVQSVVSSTQVVVARGVGVTAAGTMLDNAKLFQVGNAYEEASSRPTAQQVQPTRVTNYTQIFRNTWTISDTARATQVIVGETATAESRQDCASFHAADIEKALFFGQKSSGTRNGQPFRTMDGLVSIITQYSSGANITTAGATTNFTQLEAALDVVFNQATDPKGANERVLFVGGTALKVLNSIGRLNGTYQLMDGQVFSTIKLARGTFRIIEHPLLNTNTTWAKMAIAVDLPTFNLAYLGDRKTRNEEFGIDGKNAEGGVDAVGGTLTTELTCLVKNPSANAIIYDLTAGAAG
jgi:hypothetical protein